MTLFGTPDEWVDLIDTLVPDILDLIISTWAVMPALASDAREDPTTKIFCRRLRQNRNSADLPFRIDFQMVELDRAAGEDQGRLDIAFSPPVPREDIYFCLECKRLNVSRNGVTRSYSSEYVTHGMLRFVRGQYAVRVRNGGMLAYVLDGNVSRALASVQKIIGKRFKDLRMKKPGEMLNSSVRPGVSTLKETRHMRGFGSRMFQIHHLFVPALPS